MWAKMWSTKQVTEEWWDEEETQPKVVRYLDSRGTTISQYRLNRRGELHSGENDEPSKTEFRFNGSVRTERWYDNGDNHRDTRDPITGLTLPAVIIYKERLVTPPARVCAWYLHGRLHNADRDPKTGVLLPAWSDDEYEDRWHLASSLNTFDTPDHPELLELLAAWEEKHGVSGCPKTKSASKRGGAP